jgi:hypothetical protein
MLLHTDHLLKYTVPTDCLSTPVLLNFSTHVAHRLPAKSPSPHTATPVLLMFATHVARGLSALVNPGFASKFRLVYIS